MLGFWFFVAINQDFAMNPAQAPAQQFQDSLLRVPTITERMGVSRSYWWKGVKEGRFPAGIKLSTRVTVWRASEIDSLIANFGK
ncbi:AlpA family transcriptional regulator [Simplicispira metamorpha]|uniref:AlpA family transcriptional regulator n=1 Tax=Simplicispira metamorpha TaxID=80881 RepID=A0A4R2ND10_9BURK|nr:AlpA family transcriptional regulator [Simplicispira metamorpha]